MKLVSFLAVAFLMATSAFATQGPRPLESLHDLPSKWTGVAGGLLSRVPATLSIDKILKVTREEGPNAFLATYDIEATLALGDRKIAIRQVVMSRYSASDTNYELVFHADDDLTETVFANVTYDEVSDSYRLQESLRNGERRFLLSAPAPKQPK